MGYDKFNMREPFEMQVFCTTNLERIFESFSYDINENGSKEFSTHFDTSNFLPGRFSFKPGTAGILEVNGDFLKPKDDESILKDEKSGAILNGSGFITNDNNGEYKLYCLLGNKTGFIICDEFYSNNPLPAIGPFGRTKQFRVSYFKLKEANGYLANKNHLSNAKLDYLTEFLNWQKFRWKENSKQGLTSTIPGIISTEPERMFSLDFPLSIKTIYFYVLFENKPIKIRFKSNAVFTTKESKVEFISSIDIIGFREKLDDNIILEFTNHVLSLLSFLIDVKMQIFRQTVGYGSANPHFNSEYMLFKVRKLNDLHKNISARNLKMNFSELEVDFQKILSNFFGNEKMRKFGFGYLKILETEDIESNLKDLISEIESVFSGQKHHIYRDGEWTLGTMSARESVLKVIDLVEKKLSLNIVKKNKLAKKLVGYRVYFTHGTKQRGISGRTSDIANEVRFLYQIVTCFKLMELGVTNKKRYEHIKSQLSEWT